MTTEDGQYGYDELRWLARDTHRNRRRAIWWIAGLTLGAMTLATQYILNQREQRAAQTSEGGSPPAVTVNLDNLELDEITDSLDQINTTLGNINDKLPVAVNLGLYTDPSEGRGFLSDLIWLVDGSRRFPMAEGDILWIPEIQSWLRVTDMTRERGEIEMWDTTGSPDDPETIIMDLDVDYQHPGLSGNADCLTLAWRGESRRLGPDYVDIEVLFENDVACNGPRLSGQPR